MNRKRITEFPKETHVSFIIEQGIFENQCSCAIKHRQTDLLLIEAQGSVIKHQSI